MGWVDRTNRNRLREHVRLVAWMAEKGATWQAVLDVLRCTEDPPFYLTIKAFGRACREILARENPEPMTDAEGVALLRGLGVRSFRLKGKYNAALAGLLRDDENRRKAAEAALDENPEYLSRMAETLSLVAELLEQNADLLDQNAALRERLEAAKLRADAKIEENVALWRASLDQQARNQALREENRRLSEGVPRAAPAAPTLPEAAFSKTGF